MATIDVVRDAPRKPLMPVDENVKIPDFVKAAAERAESFYKDPNAPPAPAKTDVPQPPQPEPVTQQPPVVSNAPTSPQPVLSSVPISPQPVSHGPDAVEWENRYNSMKGRYDKSQEIIAQMQQTMSQMSQDIMGLQNALQARAAAQAPEPQRLIPKEVEDQYGAEFIELMRSAAKEALGPELERVTRENNQLKERLNVSNVQNLWATMDRIMPKWRQVNQSEEFKQWVGLRDPLSGAIRGDLLNAAFRAGNAERVMAFFRGFDPNIEAAPSPAGSTTAPPTAHAPGPVSLETLAAPGRARSAPASDVAAEKPVFTPADISRFYNDKSRGGWLGREQEADRIERAIFLAQREGRVRVQ